MNDIRKATWQRCIEYQEAAALAAADAMYAAGHNMPILAKKAQESAREFHIEVAIRLDRINGTD